MAGPTSPTQASPLTPTTQPEAQTADKRECLRYDHASFEMEVPKNAQVRVQGKPMGHRGGKVSFSSPPMEPCKPFRYEITVQWPVPKYTNYPCGMLGRARSWGRFSCQYVSWQWKTETLKPEFEASNKPVQLVVR